jgi:hypothetical protein
MEEIIFVIKESPEGGYEAAALNHSIFTEADDWDQLKLNIKEAVSCHFEDEDQKLIRLHFVKDELMTV